jgi:hypothetical protein
MTTDLLTALEPSRLGLLARTPDGLRQLLAEALAYPAALRGLWDGHRAGGERIALVVDFSTPYLSLLVALADACLLAGEVLRNDLEYTGCGADDLAALDGAAAELRALRSEIVSLRDWIASPPPASKRPHRTTAEIRAALDAGELLTIEEVMADLESAGDRG